MVLKIGSTGELVRILQSLLEIHVDGNFGPKTRASVMNFQKRNKLIPDGVVGPMTWKRLGYRPEEENLDTDRQQYENWIERYHLDEEEYIKKETSKRYIMIHHTAGRHNPYRVIDHWNKDARGRVGTNYVIGGISSDGKDNQYDGKVLRAIDDEYFGWHIGAGGSYKMKEQSLSIEICSAGGLKKENGRWYTWFKEEVDPSQVCILKSSFRGYKAFHKYSDEQIKSLKALLIFLSRKHDISLNTGLKNMLESGQDAFGWNKNIYDGKVKGLISHTNVRKDKSDVFPQPELIKMIRSL